MQEKVMLNLIIVGLIIAIVQGADEATEKLEWIQLGKQEQPRILCGGPDEMSLIVSKYTVNGGYLLYLYIGVDVPVGLKPVVKHDSVKSIELMSRASAYGRIITVNEVFSEIKFYKTENFSSFFYTIPTQRSCDTKCENCTQNTFRVEATFEHICVNNHLRTVKINTREHCKASAPESLDRVHIETVLNVDIELKIADECGRRKVEHTELIMNGEASKPGDWPWHVAIYRISGSNIKYICGGTLISQTIVLTAAHCVSIRGIPVIPESLSVVLGKYNLIGGDLETQEREVYSIIMHDGFAPKKYLEHDIALVKLKAVATLNDYVQPACIWNSDAYERLPNSTVLGTVAGWGFDQTDTLSSKLQHASMPMVSDATCIKINPLFYGNALNNNMKFCAGWANGTSACNGDSGGGFAVFVPDAVRDDSVRAAGAWHVRGIVSLSASRTDVALCDPYQYVIFTDIEKYTSWIKNHLD